MHRNWSFLCWNVRGINSDAKWNAIRLKIEESSCAVVCLQETKREVFDLSYVKKFCPRRIDKFVFVPSRGASGGMFVGWNSAHFNGQVVDQTDHALSCSFLPELALIPLIWLMFMGHLLAPKEIILFTG